MRRTRVMMISALLVLGGLGASATASAQDSLDALQQRFKERYRDIFEQKRDGKVGETFDGYVALVAEVYRDDGLDALLKSENRDRDKLYELMAKQLRESLSEQERKAVTPVIIALRNAVRNFQNAKPAEYLKMSDGVWVQKRNEIAYGQILELKQEGMIGETAGGELAVRTGDVAVARLIEQENDRRRMLYEKIAKAGGQPVEAVAEKRGRELFKAARPDDWLLTSGNRWIQTKDR